MTELTANQKSAVAYMKRSAQHAAFGFDLILKKPRPEDFFEELKASGFFAPTENPAPEPGDKEGFFRVPHWPALEYLEAVARHAGTTGSESLGHELMDLVRDIYAPENLVDNYFTHAACAKIIGLVPTPCVRLEDIELVRTWIESKWHNDLIIHDLDKYLFAALLNSGLEPDKRKAARLLEICTAIRDTEDANTSTRGDKTLLNAYWLEKTLKNRARQLGDIVQRPAVVCLVERTRQIFGSGVASEHTWVHRPAIEDHPQNHKWDHATNAFVDASRDALDAWISSNPREAVPYTLSLLQDASQIAKRLAVNAVRENWNVLGTPFQLEAIPTLFQVGLLHELYLLLREKYSEFGEEGKAKVLRAIQSITEGKEEPSAELDRARSMQRNWLHALLAERDPTVQAEYARLTASLGPIREHPEFLSYHSVWAGPGPSPYSVEEIVSLAENGSLVEAIDSFEPKEDMRHSPREALLATVSEAVASSPVSFVQYLDTERAMSRRLQYGLIEGYSQITNKVGEQSTEEFRRILDVLLPYLRHVLEDVGFWDEPEEGDGLEPNKGWIPQAAVEIVKRLSINDAIGLREDDFSELLRVVDATMNHCEGIELSDDPLNAAINNPRGRSFDSLLQLLLRRCRDSDKAIGGHENAWATFRPRVDAELDRGDRPTLESRALIGSYFPQLIFVDHQWVETRINDIFPLDNETNLFCALNGLGYASSSARVYEALQNGDVPLRALTSAAVQGGTRERMIERISLAYMWGQEQLTSPVFATILDPTNAEDLIELVGNVGRWADEELEQEQIERAKELAEVCTEIAFGDLTARRQLLPLLASFIGYVRQPSDRDMAWLLRVAPYAHEGHGAYQFVEALDSMASHSPREAAAVLDAFLRGRQPTYDYRESLQSALRRIYDAGMRTEAITLLETLVRRGGMTNLAALYTEFLERSSRP